MYIDYGPSSHLLNSLSNGQNLGDDGEPEDGGPSRASDDPFDDGNEDGPGDPSYP